MKWWVSLLIVGAVGFGMYKHYVTLDPLNLVVLVVLLWTQHVNMARQQQLADLIDKSRQLVTGNQKTIAAKIDDVRTDLRKIKV